MLNADPAWKKQLLKKGAEVAAMLSALLDKKEVNLASLPPPKDPKEDPELRLRRWLNAIDRAIKAFGTEEYGRCAVCGEELDPRALAEAPWLMNCTKHPPV